jgi:hypothetical protein
MFWNVYGLSIDLRLKPNDQHQPIIIYTIYIRHENMTAKETSQKAKQESDKFIKKADELYKDNPEYAIVRRSLIQAFMAGFLRGVLLEEPKRLKPISKKPVIYAGTKSS